MFETGNPVHRAAAFRLSADKIRDTFGGPGVVSRMLDQEADKLDPPRPPLPTEFGWHANVRATLRTEYAVRYADGDVIEAHNLAEAREDVEYAVRLLERDRPESSEFEGAEVVERCVYVSLWWPVEDAA